MGIHQPTTQQFHFHLPFLRQVCQRQLNRQFILLKSRRENLTLIILRQTDSLPNLQQRIQMVWVPQINQHMLDLHQRLEILLTLYFLIMDQRLLFRQRPRQKYQHLPLLSLHLIIQLWRQQAPLHVHPPIPPPEIQQVFLPHTFLLYQWRQLLAPHLPLRPKWLITQHILRLRDHQLINRLLNLHILPHSHQVLLQRSLLRSDNRIRETQHLVHFLVTNLPPTRMVKVHPTNQAMLVPQTKHVILQMLLFLPINQKLMCQLKHHHNSQRHLHQTNLQIFPAVIQPDFPLLICRQFHWNLPQNLHIFQLYLHLLSHLNFRHSPQLYRQPFHHPSTQHHSHLLILHLIYQLSHQLSILQFRHL